MKLWYLETIEPFDYDEHDAFVYVADNEAGARSAAELAANNWRQKGRWLDPARSTCTEITPQTVPDLVDDDGCIIASYNAG